MLAPCATHSARWASPGPRTGPIVRPERRMAPGDLMRAGGRAIAAAIVVSTAVFAARTLDKRVDVGGYRLHLRCVGEGGPVVVLDAGAGDTLGTWDWVVPEIR